MEIATVGHFWFLWICLLFKPLTFLSTFQRVFLQAPELAYILCRYKATSTQSGWWYPSVQCSASWLQDVNIFANYYDHTWVRRLRPNYQKQTYSLLFQQCLSSHRSQNYIVDKAAKKKDIIQYIQTDKQKYLPDMASLVC